MLYYIIAIFMIIILIVVVNTILNLNEHFGNFSPYAGNHMYPFVFQQAKSKDRKYLMEKLKIWEEPFNCHANAGYYDAEPKGIPPLTKICSY